MACILAALFCLDMDLSTVMVIEYFSCLWGAKEQLSCTQQWPQQNLNGSRKNPWISSTTFCHFRLKAATNFSLLSGSFFFSSSPWMALGVHSCTSTKETMLPSGIGQRWPEHSESSLIAHGSPWPSLKARRCHGRLTIIDAETHC